MKIQVKNVLTFQFFDHEQIKAAAAAVSSFLSPTHLSPSSPLFISRDVFSSSLKQIIPTTENAAKLSIKC